MRKNPNKIIKFVMALTILFTTLSTATFAAWWGTPGYEWARSKGLVRIADTSWLNSKVSHDEFYSILLKYLEYKDVVPKKEAADIKQNWGGYEAKNKALQSMVNRIIEYLNKDVLSINEYRQMATHIDAVKKIVADNQAVLNRNDIKNLNLNLSIIQYQCALKISDADYKNLVLSNLAPTKIHNVGAVKYSGLARYKIKPYFSDISRKEFLVLMFSLLSDQNVDENEIINRFSASGVILGYDNDLMEEKSLTYAEMLTFLRRFETFEFNPIETEDGEDTGTQNGITEYK